EALLERRDATLPVIYYRRYLSKLEALKAQANEAKWAIWWAEGRALSQEQGIMLALQASREMLSHCSGIHGNHARTACYFRSIPSPLFTADTSYMPPRCS